MKELIILQGNSSEVLKDFPNDSIDAIITDPPYGLKFMGKKWDYDVPSVEIWREVIRVLKPGGHLLSFGGTRTYHRMVIAIEDAGFEIRDQIQWLYGSGFPKSHNIEKASGDSKFAGWGTALKPANEPIVLARKPLEKGLTIAENVLKYGTGALNIDASRIGSEGGTAKGNPPKEKSNGIYGNGINGACDILDIGKGRFPANILLDEEAAQMLDEQSGGLRARGNKNAKQHVGDYEASSYKFGNRESGFAGDSGGASRFFYVAKSSKRERGEGNNHPTVKPIKLMEYLIKLITPPNGIVLDPFMGSGTTGVAAKNLGFEFIGIEMNEEYCEIAKKRTGTI